MARFSSAAVVEWSATGSYTWPVVSGVYVTQLRPIVSHQRWDAIHSLTIASPEREQQGEGVSGASAPTEEMETLSLIHI